MPMLKIDTRILGSNGTQVSEVILFRGSAKHQYPHISNVITFSRGARDSKIGKKWPESSRILDYILSKYGVSEV